MADNTTEERVYTKKVFKTPNVSSTGEARGRPDPNARLVPAVARAGAAVVGAAVAVAVAVAVTGAVLHLLLPRVLLVLEVHDLLGRHDNKGSVWYYFKLK